MLIKLADTVFNVHFNQMCLEKGKHKLELLDPEGVIKDEHGFVNGYKIVGQQKFLVVESVEKYELRMMQPYDPEKDSESKEESKVKTQRDEAILLIDKVRKHLQDLNSFLDMDSESLHPELTNHLLIQRECDEYIDFIFSGQRKRRYVLIDENKGYFVSENEDGLEFDVKSKATLFNFKEARELSKKHGLAIVEEKNIGKAHSFEESFFGKL